jgi:hypothetical protein
MINVSELIVDPDFGQSYTVYRKNGYWQNFKFVEGDVSLPFFGVISAANYREINSLPEGDRVSGIMVFYTTADNPFLLTRDETGNLGTADQPYWRGCRYKAIKLFPFDDYGYQKIMAVRMQGS